MGATGAIEGPVLVTGAAGFIGRRVVAALRQIDVAPIALSLPAETPPDEWGDTAEIRRGDVTDPTSVRAALDGVRTVIHLAALVAEQNADYDAHWAVTAEGSNNVYLAAAEHEARVVVTTSICAYGDRIPRAVCAEDDARGQHQGPYGRAKQAQEDFALAAHRDLGLRVTIVRPSNVYGIGSRPWVEMMAERLATDEMPLIGDGSGNAGLVYVDNLADALVLVAGAEEAVGRTYNVCDGLDVTWRTYLSDLAAIVGGGPPTSVDRDALVALASTNEDPAALVGPRDETIPSLEGLNLMGSDSRFPTDRIRADLGWSPRVGYAEAMATIADALRRRTA